MQNEMNSEQEQEEDGPLSPMDRRVDRSRFSKRQIAVAVAALVVLVFGALSIWGAGLSNSLNVDASRITTSQAQVDDFREYVLLTGNVAPGETVYLDAVDGGQVVEVLAEEGATVEPGEPLLVLKNTNLQLQVVEAEAQLTEQIMNLNTSRLDAEQSRLSYERDLLEADKQIASLEADLSRGERLLAVDAIAASDVEDLRIDLDYQRDLRSTLVAASEIDEALQTTQTEQLESAVNRISESLGIARDNLDNLVMRAPIGGQLSVFEANVGESKAPGQRIGQVDDNASVKVLASVNEFYLGRIAVGQEAMARIGSRQHVLRVSKILPNVVEHEFQIELLFADGDPEQIQMGQSLTMELDIGEGTESLTVANGPWVEDTGGTWAFILSADGSSAARRDISIGRRNPGQVEVTSGLTEGERIITSSYSLLQGFERIDLSGGTPIEEGR